MICPVNLHFISKHSLDGLQSNIPDKSICLFRIYEGEISMLRRMNFYSGRISFPSSNRALAQHHCFPEYFADITHICQYRVDKCHAITFNESRYALNETSIRLIGN